jgi:thymidylate kinase
MPERGKLIVLEGADGDLLEELSGSLYHWMRGLGVAVERTSEPTSGPVGALVQLWQQGRLAFVPGSLALLLMADRLDHVARENGILSWLDAGRHVLCTRYLLSSLALLPVSDQAPLDWHRQINRRCPTPDLTLYLEPKTAVDDRETRTLSRYARAARALSDAGEPVCWVDADAMGQQCRHEIARLLSLGDN